MQFCNVFHTQHAIVFATLDTRAGTIDLAITRNTYVNVCSLNCLNLFLKYKIGLTYCVCVCVFRSKCLTLFLMRDIFESLKCCLDL